MFESLGFYSIFSLSIFLRLNNLATLSVQKNTKTIAIIYKNQLRKMHGMVGGIVERFWIAVLLWALASSVSSRLIR